MMRREKGERGERRGLGFWIDDKDAFFDSRVVIGERKRIGISLSDKIYVFFFQPL